jgi:putative spermidine/putrescine transport system substrate-binding protein
LNAEITTKIIFPSFPLPFPLCLIPNPLFSPSLVFCYSLLPIPYSPLLMNRRSFLIYTSTIALSQLLAGCGGNQNGTLTVRLLKDSLPNQVINQFQGSLQKNTELNISLAGELLDIFKQLETWQNKTDASKNNWLESLQRLIFFWKSHPKTDVVTLGDFWLKQAIEKKLIQPLDVAKLPQWSALPKQWQELVTRNDQGFPDPKGRVWAAPYRWGSTIIVYRQDKFKQYNWKPPQDWEDLFRDELRDRISLLDHPREVIGLVLKKLGKSYNTTDLKLPDLQLELKKLHQQVKFYDSDKYIEPLLLGDTLVAVGWSHEILPTIVRYPTLAAITPKSGTSMWADTWVNPNGSQSKQELLNKWINFFWQTPTAKQVAIKTRSNSPVPTKISESDIQEPLRKVLLQDADKSEFLLPLSPEVEKQYQELFEKMKNAQI